MTKNDLPLIGQVFHADAIPEQLKAMRRWVMWKAVWNASRGKYDKIPFHPHGYGISTKDVHKCCTFNEVHSVLVTDKDSKYAGVGFVLTNISDFIGVDLDNCVTDGVIAPWAAEIVNTLDSYCEVSPSGNGLRIFSLGTSSTDWNNHEQGIEVYAGNTPRFLTITGDVRQHTKPMTRAPDEVLAALKSQYSRTNKTTNVIPIAMPELIADLALPELTDLGLSEKVYEFLALGPQGGEDRSAALHAAGVQLYSLGLSDAEVLSHMSLSKHAMEIALAHRGGELSRAMQYLWIEHCVKAKPKAVTRDSILAGFDDLSNDPVVIKQQAQLKKTLKKQAAKFTIQTTSEFVVRRHASWCIKNFLPQANLGVIYGESGSGKSFFAFDLLASVQRGIEWQGRKVEQGEVLWIAAEGQEDMRKRVTAYCEHAGITPDQLGMSFVDEAPNFMEELDITALINRIRAHGPKKMVVVDTLAQVMSGGNENSSEDMGRVLNYCRRIATETGAMVILIHHSGKDASRGARGWSGLRAASDFELEIVRADNDRVATLTKLKGGQDGVDVGFLLSTINVGQDADGDPETTCVVHYTDKTKQDIATAKAPGGEHKKQTMATAETLLSLNDGVLTRNELLNNVLANREAKTKEGKRDTRKQDISKEINQLIEGGYLQENANGLISAAKVVSK